MKYTAPQCPLTMPPCHAAMPRIYALPQGGASSSSLGLRLGPLPGTNQPWAQVESLPQAPDGDEALQRRELEHGERALPARSISVRQVSMARWPEADPVASFACWGRHTFKRQTSKHAAGSQCCGHSRVQVLDGEDGKLRQTTVAGPVSTNCRAGCPGCPMQVRKVAHGKVLKGWTCGCTQLPGGRRTPDRWMPPRSPLLSRLGHRSRPAALAASPCPSPPWYSSNKW